MDERRDHLEHHFRRLAMAAENSGLTMMRLVLDSIGSGIPENGPNVMMVPISYGVHNDAGSEDDVKELRGFPERELVKAKQKMRDTSRAQLPPICPRQSKKIRKWVIDADCSYEM